MMGVTGFPFLAGATDDDLLAWLQENDVPAFMVDLGRDDKDSDGHTNLEWRGRTYLKLVRLCIVKDCPADDVCGIIRSTF